MLPLVVQAIIIPADVDVPPQPSISHDKKITDVIEVVPKANLKQIIEALFSGIERSSWINKQV